jgi:hypothetical protein
MRAPATRDEESVSARGRGEAGVEVKAEEAGEEKPREIEWAAKAGRACEDRGFGD